MCLDGEVVVVGREQGQVGLVKSSAGRQARRACSSASVLAHVLISHPAFSYELRASTLTSSLPHSFRSANPHLPPSRLL